MGILFGNSNINEIYYGSHKIKEVYYGSTLIWPLGNITLSPTQSTVAATGGSVTVNVTANCN